MLLRKGCKIMLHSSTEDVGKNVTLGWLKTGKLVSCQMVSSIEDGRPLSQLQLPPANIWLSPSPNSNTEIMPFSLEREL